jgi:hypothetical protein
MIPRAETSLVATAASQLIDVFFLSFSVLPSSSSDSANLIEGLSSLLSLVSLFLN